MIVWVTGAGGFVGSALVSRLCDLGHDIVGTVRDCVAASDRISASAKRAGSDVTESRRGEVTLRTLEIPDVDGARTLLREVRPDAIVHLAAIAAVPVAEEKPDRAMAVNADGTASLLQAMHAENSPARLVHISTSTVYGVVPADAQPIVETRGAQPINVYSWSKLAAEGWVHAYSSLLQNAPTILRPFNHVGAGQSSHYALSGFAKQIAEIEQGGRDPIVRVGNLGVRRDILDSRDVIAAYVEALENPSLAGTLQHLPWRGVSTFRSSREALYSVAHRDPYRSGRVTSSVSGP